MKRNIVKFRVEDLKDQLPSFILEEGNEYEYGIYDGDCLNPDTSIVQNLVAILLLKDGRKLGQGRFVDPRKLEFLEEEWVDNTF